METTGRQRGAKYMEGHLEFKEASKWVPYWVVIRGRQLFIFKDANTQIKENIQGHVDIGTNSYFACGKTSKGKFEFEIKADGGKKYLFRANTEILRLQWVHTLGLAAQGKLPPASPDPATDNSSNNNKETVTSNTKSSNQYSEVPNFNISPDVAPGVNVEEMQKKIVSNKKHNSFSSHAKKLWGLKEKLGNKSVDSVEESCRPESEGAEASSEPFYDEFPADKPPWYFGKIKREDADTLLQSCSHGSFLVRDSESVRKPGAYTLSLRHRDKCRHHKIETLPDGNLVINGHPDKPFPNLATLMKYFTKSQEKDIQMQPVFCKEQDTTDNSHSPAEQKSYEQMDHKQLPVGNRTPPTGYETMGSQACPPGTRPPVLGCEDGPTTETSASISPRVKHPYENLPDKQKAKPPLMSRVTSPDLHKVHGYENLPSKDKQLPVGNRTPPTGYEAMGPQGAPILPPRRHTPNAGHGYENIPEKEEEPLPPAREPTSSEGYVNLPPRPGRASSAPDGYVNLPSRPGGTSGECPALPPRKKSQTLGYENVPTRDDTRVPSRPVPYQNIPPNVPSRHSQSSGRAHPPVRRSATVPAHIMQNTLGTLGKDSY